MIQSTTARPFQFRLSQLLAAMAMIGVVCAAFHYQSMLGLTAFFAVLAVAIAWGRVPFRFNLSLMSVGLALSCGGSSVMWPEAHDVQNAAFRSIIELAIPLGLMIFLGSAWFLTFNVWVYWIDRIGLRATTSSNAQIEKATPAEIQSSRHTP